jgi:hypothetical protein
MKGLIRLAFRLVIVGVMAIGAACASGSGVRLTATSLLSAASTPVVFPPGPGVADVLANPPAPGQSVELDAYFSEAGAPSMPGGSRLLPPDQVLCPDFVGARPSPTFPGDPHTFQCAHSNHLPDDDSWLIATIPEATRPGGARSCRDSPTTADSEVTLETRPSPAVATPSGSSSWKRS